MNMKSEKPTPEFDDARKAYMKGNFDKAFHIWHEQAENGDADAQAWIGAMYANGDGRDMDYGKANSWYLRAAEQGHAMAQANVGVAYYTGTGVEKDLDTAVHWLSAAADAGDLNGLFNLAVLYSKGEVLPGDDEAAQKRAAELYQIAAERGHYPSQSRVGYMFSVGKGVPKDRVQAYLWLTLASQHGIGTALDALETVVKSMSSEEKSAGANLFEEWRLKTKSNEGPVALYPAPS
jgi:TPR repeat protein